MRFLLFFIPLYLFCDNGNNNIIAQTYGKLTLSPTSNNVNIELNYEQGAQSTNFQNDVTLPILTIENQSISKTFDEIEKEGHVDVPIEFSYQPNPELPGGFQVLVAILIQRVETNPLSKNFNKASWITLNAPSNTIVPEIGEGTTVFQPRIDLQSEFLYKKDKKFVPLSYWYFLPNGYILSKSYDREKYVVGQTNTAGKASQKFFIRIPYQQILYGRTQTTSRGVAQYVSAYVEQNLKQIASVLPFDVQYWFSITMYLNEISDQENDASTSQNLELQRVNAQIVSIDQYLLENISEDQNKILEANKKQLQEKKEAIEKAQGKS